jgi:aminoglycoside 6-adenylyltransferase
MLAGFVRWAEARDAVRAVILTSSRANPHAPIDAFSDYDVILSVTDTRPFVDDEGWHSDFGDPVVRFRDRRAHDGMEEFFRLVLYADGTKIDFTVAPVEMLRRIARSGRLSEALDVGYRVLADKDGLTAALARPTYTAHIPPKPTAAEYHALVEEFWWETTYVAKNLWRDELFAARYNLDCVIRADLVRRMLEWYIEIAHGWSVKPGAMGRFLKQRLPPDVWVAVEGTFVGPSIAENWQALFHMTRLFHRIATDVAGSLGYAYPHEIEDGVMRYLLHVQERAERA